MPRPNIIKIFQTIKRLCHTQEFGLEIRSENITRKQLQRGLSFCNATHRLVLFYASTKYYQNIRIIKKLLSAQEFGLEIYSVEFTRKGTKQEVSFLHATLLLNLIYVPPKYYQIISNSMGVMTCTRFRLQGRYVHNNSESCVFCTQHAFWSSSMPQLNTIIIFQTIKKLWNAQEFGLEIYSGEITREKTKQELYFLHLTF